MVAAPQGHRFQAWAASLVFSCVCLASHASTTGSSRDGAENWVLAMLCIVFIFSFLACAAYIAAKDKFIGQKPEGAVSFMLVIFWCAGLPTIMNPSREIAVSGFIQASFVSNANLYFFSWVSFICMLFVFGNFTQEYTGRDVVSEITPKQSKWMGLLASSLVMLAASADIHRVSNCAANLDRAFCSRNAYAISLGVLGALFSMGMLYMANSGKLTIMIEFGVASITFILMTFGVAYITFGSGPGTTIGNLYFATWIAFCISVFLAFQSFREFMESRTQDTEGDEEDNKAAAAPTAEEVEQAIEVPAE